MHRSRVWLLPMLETGVPPAATPGGGHGFSDGTRDRFGSKHCCGRRELAGRHRHQSQGTQQLCHANWLLFIVLYIFFSVSRCALATWWILPCMCMDEKHIIYIVNNTAKTLVSAFLFHFTPSRVCLVEQIHSTFLYLHVTSSHIFSHDMLFNTATFLHFNTIHTRNLPN
jgi:hypothetical protein